MLKLNYALQWDTCNQQTQQQHKQLAYVSREEVQFVTIHCQTAVDLIRANFCISMRPDRRSKTCQNLKSGNLRHFTLDVLDRNSMYFIRCMQSLVVSYYAAGPASTTGRLGKGWPEPERSYRHAKVYVERELLSATLRRRNTRNMTIFGDAMAARGAAHRAR